MAGEPIHPLLELAARCFEQAFRGAPHAGGPRPVVGHAEQARLALRVALALVEQENIGELRDHGRDRLHYRLGQLGDLPPVAAPNLRAAQHHIVRAAERVLTRAAGEPVLFRRQMTQFIADAADAWPGEAEDFLRLLDRELLRAEILSLPRGHADLADLTVIFRAGELPARPLLWLLRREDGTLVLVVRLAGRLTRFEGRAEDVLASVPDPWFAEAVAAASR
jgi:hypothetical protein